MKINPKTMFWTQEAKNVDGSALDTSTFLGFVLYVNGKEFFAVPLGWDQDGAYEFPIAQVGFAPGKYQLGMSTRVRVAGGIVESEITQAEDEILIAPVPRRPLAFSVA